MPKQWENIFKGIVALLGVLAVLPLVQLALRKTPFEAIDLTQIKAISMVEERSDTEKKSMSRPAPLPEEIEQRTEKLNSSGILGRIPQPPPMALIGIAEPYAFVRTPKGQTGKVKEGESLGGVKVLKVGSNRVLVEHEGRKSELQIFSGIGSESLLSN